jgi:signal transduction histidine kinase
MDTRNKLLSIVPGCLCVLLGIIVISGWYTQTLNLIQIHSSFAPMQYNTALGFCEALQWQADRFMESTDIKCKLNITPEGIKLVPELSTDLFRMFQEALTNISRHSQASNVRVDFVENKSDYELKVQDDGVGIDRTRIVNSNSLGLLGIRERALIWNGHVDINGVVGEGTQLTVRIPKVNNDK